MLLRTSAASCMQLSVVHTVELVGDGEGVGDGDMLLDLALEATLTPRPTARPV